MIVYNICLIKDGLVIDQTQLDEPDTELALEIFKKSGNLLDKDSYIDIEPVEE